MAILKFNIYLLVTVLTLKIVCGIVNEVPLPTIDLEEWWGPGNASRGQDTSIKNFKIEFKPAMISELKNRLRSHRRFTPPLEGIAFEYGFNSKSLQLWIDYLSEKYPFAEREAFLNQYSHFKTNIQGLNIHFVRVKTQNVGNKEVIPLLILHGWPGSVREFYETIPYLLSASKAKGFALDIIMPSLPGYGFSDPAVRPGMGVDKVAIICRNLMHRLGYSHYYIQGGDMGGIITSVLATFFPNEVKGYHTNFPLLHNPDILFRLILGSYHPEEIADSDVLGRIYPFSTKLINTVARTGYLHLQATKPDTFGVGLSDSPSGLMAHTLITTGIPDKPANNLTAVQLLDNYMIYWSTNCVTTAMRLYSETFNKRYIGLRINEIRSPVPTWMLQAPDEIIYLPPWMVKLKFTNLLHQTLPSEGGHFYAWTYPKQFAEDVTDAIVAFRIWHAKNSTIYTKCTSYISN